MVDGSGLAEAMLGLAGVRVTGVFEADGEVTIEVETTEPRAWCERCGCRAESQDRMWVDVRDLECFGRSTRLRIWKRRWRCRELVDDPNRVGAVRQLGVDETSFLRANRDHHTIYATGLVDL